MYALRLYDPARRPPNWTDIVGPSQFVAFASDADTGAPTEADGRPFPVAEEMTGLVFDSLAEARAFAEARVEARPSLRFDVFEGAGRVRPPLVAVVSPARSARLDTHPRSIRIRTWVAILLAVGALPLIYYDWTGRGVLILPTVLGINMILAACRLLFLNGGLREAERTRIARLERHD